MNTTGPATPKPIGVPVESALLTAAPKPVENKPADLDAALAAALGINVDKPAPVDPDKASADLKKRFSGEEPAAYVDKMIPSHLVDINAVRTDPNRLRDEVKRFYDRRQDDHIIRNRVDDVERSVVQTVSQARGKEVDFRDSQVQDLLMKELESDALQNLEVQNAVNAGSVTLAELTQYTFFQTMLAQNPPGTAIRFPEDGVHQDMISGRNDQWEKLVAGDSAEIQNTQRLAKEDRPDQQQLLDELNVTKEWAGLDPAKQREVVEYAAGRSLDRIGQLGDRLLRDRQPVGLVLLTVSGRFSADHIPLVTGLPQGQALLQRFTDIRKNGGDVRLATEAVDRLHYTELDTVGLDPGLKIKELRVAPDHSKVRFASYTQGPSYIVEQMMGMKPLEPKPQRAF